MSVETLDIFECNSHVDEKKAKITLGVWIVNGLKKGLVVLHGWNERQRSLHQLAQLDDRMLKDIGISRADVEGELEKSLWVK